MDQEKDVISFESLHHQFISCVAISKSGELIATGSKDSTVRLWKLEFDQSSSRELNIDLIHQYTGHRCEVSCIDINTDYTMLVSGCVDGNGYVWDIRTGRLRLILSKHEDKILSVSINSSNGDIITLTALELRLYSINGDLLCSEKFMDHINDAPLQYMTPGCTVIAVPTSEWQTGGVVAITGHENGQVFLWKYRSIPNLNNENFSNKMSEKSQNSIKMDPNFGDSSPSSNALSTADSGFDDSVAFNKVNEALNPSPHGLSERPFSDFKNVKLKRELTIITNSNVIKTHRADISCIKLLNSSNASGLSTSGMNSRIKDFVDRSLAFDETETVDLFVGDCDGFVSRWSVQRLDQLTQADLQSLRNVLLL